jgi:hypothetical protein
MKKVILGTDARYIENKIDNCVTIFKVLGLMFSSFFLIYSSE